MEAKAQWHDSPSITEDASAKSGQDPLQNSNKKLMH